MPHKSIKAATIQQSPTFEFTSNPFDNIITVYIDNKGSHPTKGLDVTMNTDFERLQVLACEKGTPAGKIERWRSTIKNGLLLRVNGNEIKSMASLKRIIQENQQPQISLDIAAPDKQAIHPQSGVPQLYFDQLNHIGKHLFLEMEYNPEWMKEEYYRSLPKICKARSGIIPKGRRRSAKLTRKKLMQRDDWQDWFASENKQLDQYEKQKMFDSPIKPPPNANILPFLWTYLIKDDGTKRHAVSVMALHQKEQSHWDQHMQEVLIRLVRGFFGLLRRCIICKYMELMLVMRLRRHLHQ